MTVADAILSRRVEDLPGRREEDWRWSDLRALYRQIPEPSPVVTVAPDNPSLDIPRDHQEIYLNGTLAGPPAALVPRVETTMVRRFISATSGSAHHVTADLATPSGSTLVLIDSFEGLEGGYLSSFSGSLKVTAGSRVERLVLLDDAADAVSVGRLDVQVDEGGAYLQTVLARGARRQRVETRVQLGGDARLRLDGVTLLDGTLHADQTTVVEHSGVGGASDQLVKAVASGRARAVFQGRIIVSEGADGTDARMGSHGLILSDAAECDSKPELEIYADDVQCSHGNTVGSLDTDALFYIRARGVPELEAKAMLMTAFIGSVVERIEDDGARALAEAFISVQLEGML